VNVLNKLHEGYDVDDIESIMVVCDGPPICGRSECDRVVAQSVGCPLCRTVYQMDDGMQLWHSPTEH
jgi:hypothetical protein